MIIQTFSVGPMQANCYILGCEGTRSALVIDPGDEDARIISALNENKLQLELIVNTHGHVDHIVANEGLKEATSAQLCIHSADADMLVNPRENLSFFIGEQVFSPAADLTLADGDILEVGTLKIEVIHTPGHSQGSICLLVDDCIFTGDLLFAGGIGRYDFPGSSYEDLMNSLKKVMSLDDDLVVYPGHGPATTIGDERRTNPFLQ
ncbi:MBL fold metallo-hydrolase [Candidatus Poribacteria bacterium]